MRAPPSQAPNPEIQAAGEDGMIEIAAIDLGERAGRDMGDLNALMACITAEGLRRSITVGPTNRLVLGPRRLEACRRLGWRRIDAVTVTMVPEALDRLREDNADATCAHPLSIKEAVRMDFAIRELKWWPRDGSVKAVTEALGRHDRRDQMAALLGMNGRQYGYARELVLATRGYREKYGERFPVSPEDRERAEEALATADSPSDLGAALRMYRERESPPPATPLRGPKRLPSRDQAQGVTSALGVLSGITAGLARAIPLEPELPAATIAQWEREIAEPIRVLNRFRRELKRHGHHNDG